jgi:hypothetical protein
MDDLERYIAVTQRQVTYAYVVLFAAAFSALVFLPKPMDETVKTIIVSLISVLGTVIVQQSNFWFARSRAAGIPNPPDQVSPPTP